jgi:uncharacterized membrane protein YphA (DoxX/SURF4 family)
VCRIILALTFIFSGFVKSVDPWGTAIKIGEYLSAFDMEWLYSWRMALAIWLTGAELMMGLMLLFNIRPRLISIFALLAMTFFTCLTFVIALWNPVEDCGCFGDAIKLTNWQTFIKNLILLPMSIVFFCRSRKLPIMPTWRDAFFMLLFGCIAFGIGFYSYMHLPLIDFLPYKEGTNLVEAMKDTGRGDVETTVIYRDRQTGEEHEFDLNDTTWYDDSRWEYVDTKTVALHSKIHPSVRDFAIFDSKKVVTQEILDEKRPVLLICAADTRDITRRCAAKLESAARQARERGYRVLCLTSEPLHENPELVVGAERIPCYNMDASTMITMLRAKTGIVALKSGVILDKYNCRDIPAEMPIY